MSFVRLTDTIYFKKHLAQFTVSTSHVLHNSLTHSNIAPMQQHKKFIEVIRETVWSTIQFEYELPPSFDALWRHRSKACWVSNMWSQGTQNQLALLLSTAGW